MSITRYGYRLQQLSKGTGLNWFFLPAGPGLGSEYLTELCHHLDLPGSTFLVDFPRDGTNIHGNLDVQVWQEGLLDLVSSYSDVILVTHSFAGMVVLNLPHIERHLRGLVLMNTTTHATFMEHVAAMRDQHQLPDLLPAASQYHLYPSRDTYQTFWEDYKYYCFTAEEMSAGEKLMALFAFNSAAYNFAIQNFFPGYRAQWVPTIIPVMTLASENDYVCPPTIFINDECYQRKNIMNQLLQDAGHFPWLKQLRKVQQCFAAFVQEFLLS
jgi:pimeloyl-ACP methyl ester carboxylesterase